MTRPELRHQLLLALLQGDATAARLAVRVMGHTGRAPTGLYFALREMEASGLLTCWEAPPLPGETRTRVHFHLTSRGLLSIALWEEWRTRSWLNWFVLGGLALMSLGGLVTVAIDIASSTQLTTCALVLLALALARLSRGWP